EVGGEPGAKDALAELALNAPAYVLGPDPEIGTLAVGTGDVDVARHDPWVSPLPAVGSVGSLVLGPRPRHRSRHASNREFKRLLLSSLCAGNASQMRPASRAGPLSMDR